MSEEKHVREYHYFVDGVKYSTENVTVTGAYIKSQISGFEPEYSLYLEGHGNDADELITDASTVTLDHGEKHFYTVPPATFGAQ